MKTNPEFLRQIWLQFSLPRLILTPVLLLLGAYAVYTSSDSADGGVRNLIIASLGAFCVLVFLFGSYSVGMSISDEIQEKTWDQQRMSALTPWSMTWGKLFGAASFAWYGGLICLLIYFSVAWQASEMVGGQPLRLVAILLLTGVLLHALALASSLQSLAFAGQPARRGMGLLFVILIILPNLAALFFRGQSELGQVVWWGGAYETLDFLLASSLLFAACLLLTATRQMSDNLAVRLYPWGWPVLAIVLTLYFGAFVEQLHLGRNSLYGSPRGFALVFMGLGISAVMTYLALFSQPHTPSAWQSLGNSCAEKNWQRTLQKVPPWVTSLVLTWVFLFVLGTLSLTRLGTWDFFQSIRTFSPISFAASLACLLVRDACLLLFFSFKPKARRVFPTFATCFFLLYGLLPGLAGLSSLDGLAQTIRPWGSALIALLHALAAGGLLAWRWQKIKIR